MNFKNWLKQLSEKTLYHGTVIDNIPSIQKFGILSGIGSFVQDNYGDYEDSLEDLSFAADKKGIERALTAMVHNIGKKLGKDFHDVSDNDIRNHGVLFIIRNGDSFMSQRPYEDKYRDDSPVSVEPGDYYSDSDIEIDHYLTGSALLRYFRRLGVWPRDWGPQQWDSKLANNNLIKGDLARRAIAFHKNQINKDEVIAKVNQLPNSKLMHHLNTYRKK